MTKRIKNIGIAGEGKMGSNLFYYLLNFDFFIRLKCSSGADIEKIRKTFLRKITRSRDAGSLSESTFDKIKTRTVISTENEILSDCDLIIEAIPEQIDLKRAFFKTIDGVLNEECIIASNSSSINPSRLIPSLKRSPLFLGLHFFYPIPLINIVEIIVPGSFYNPAIQTLTAFFDKIDRKYILLDENNSFVLNRIFLDFQNESFLMVKNGHITIRQLDALVRKYFFPMGVFEFIDSVGIDTMHNSIINYVENYPHKDYYSSLINHLGTMVQKGFLGQKSGNGFYQYPGGEISEKITEPDPGSDPEGKIAEHLRSVYLSSVRRYTSQSKLSIPDMNEAIKEYFCITKGPFDLDIPTDH